MKARSSFLVRILVICGFILAVTGPAGASGSFQPKLIHFPGHGLQAILVNPPAPATTDEGGGQAEIGVVLDSLPTAIVTIPVNSNNISEGTPDVPGLVFTPENYDTEQFITVTGEDDFVDDGDVAYVIDLGPAESGDLDYSGYTGSVGITNIDNDPGVTVTPTGGLTTSEGDPPSTDSFTVVLNSQPAADVTISLISDNDLEGIPDTDLLTFTSGNWMSAQTIVVSGVDDFVDDGDLPYKIITGNTSSGDGNYDNLDVADVNATNLDDDTPGILLSPDINFLTSEAGGSATFYVSLTSEPTANVTLALSSNDPSEGDVTLPESQTMTFIPAEWNIPQPATVTGKDDHLIDGDVDYQVKVEVSSSADPLYAALAPVFASVTNQDDDDAGIIVDTGDGVTTKEPSMNDSFSMVLTSEPTAEVTVNLGPPDSSEGNLPVTAHNFTGGAGGNWNVPWVVAVEGVDDDQIDGDITYDIQLDVTTADPDYSTLPPLDPVSVTNVDDDVAGFLFTNAEGLITKEDGTPATFYIALKSQPAAAVTLPLQSSNTAEGTISIDSLTFTPGEWSDPHPVTITGIDDHLADGSVNYSIITGNPTSEDANYDVLTAQDVPNVPVVNADDDEAGVTISPNANLATTEGQGTATINVVLNTQPTRDVEITLSSDDPGEGVFNPEHPEQPATLTFSPSNWDSIQSVVLLGVDDLQVDGDVPYAVQVATQSLDPNYDDQVSELSAINQDAPTIQWVKPENHDPYYETASLAPILLGVEPISAEPVAYIRFYRWNPQSQKNVELFVDNAAPYEFYLDPAELDIDFNQIYAYAVDDEVNPTQSVHVRLVISRLAALYLPIMSK